LRLGIAAHFYETKAFGSTRVALHHNFGTGDGTELTKRLLEIAIAHRVRQIAHVQFIAHARDS
jgi:hypothetical protein